MKKKFTFLMTAMALIFAIIGPHEVAWGQTRESILLFSEGFGDNSGSARPWNDSYKEQGGISAVYSNAVYTMTNLKQGKNNTGYVKSGINQSTSGDDAIFEFGPLNVADYNNLSAEYYWKAASIKQTYTTNIYYKTSNTGSYIEIPNSAVGATTFVQVNVELPEAAQVNTLYLKIVFNTSNTQAIIDEFKLYGEQSTPSTDPVINVESTEVNLAYDETEKIFSCTVSNPTEEGALIFNLQEGIDWITNLSYITDGIYLNAETNDSYETRSAEITLSYEGAEDVVVTVNQAGRPAPSITCADITDVPYEGVTDAEATVTFNNAEGWNPSIIGDGTVVTAASLSENTVTYSVSENEGDTDREGSFTITLSKDGEEPVSKVVSVTQNHFVVDYATLPFSYDGNGSGELPSGLTQNGLGTYSSSPKMKFDGEGDYLILKINENPGTLTFDIKGNPSTGSTIINGTFTVQASIDGEEYIDVASYSDFGSTISTKTITDLASDVRYIKWIYTNKESGNVALGNIQLEKSASVATPTFTPAGGTYTTAQNVTITCATEGASIRYTTNGDEPTSSSTLYENPIPVSTTTTIKAIAYVGNEASNVATAVYTIISIPTYASLAELIAAGEPTTGGTPVNVTLTDETITGIFTTTQGYRNGIFLQVGNQEIEIYCHDVPEDWVIGGTVSGTLENCTWKKFNSTWELCPDSWGALTYSAPQLYSITVFPNAFSEVTTSPADEAAAGTEVTITISNIEEHYHISEITVYDSYDNLVSVDDNGKFTMPESDVSISVTFLPDPQFFIHYYSNGSSDSFEIVYAGPIGELREPSELNFPEGFTFAGWSTSMASTTAITETYNVTENTDLFAIFAKVEGGSGETTATLTNSEIIGSSSLTSSYGNFTITNTYGTWSGNGCKQGNYSGDGMYFLQLRNNEETVSYLKLPTFPGNITSVVCEQVCNTSKTQYTGNIYFRTAADNNADAIVTATSNEALDNVTLNIPSGYTTGYIMVSNPCRIFSFTVTYQSGVTRYYTRVFQDHIILDDITIEGPSIITAGSTLNMDTYTLTSTNPANLVIEDGGQLIHHNAGVQATMRKEVRAYSTTEGVNNGWYFVASPMAALTSHNLNNGTFDLYKFEQSADKEWKNYESTAFSITNKEGYLYANAANTTIEFVGTLNATDGSKPLAYADVRFAGFNLIGNPFACNANIGTQDFYICNGENIILAENSTIAPCTGIMVKANTTGESVTFVKGEETTRATNAMDITIAKATRNANTIDRARINFSGDSQLSKFFFNENSCLYIPQNGEDFAVVAAQNEGELPVNFKAEKNGTYTITVNTENVEANYLHLIDNMTGMDTDLLSTSSYTFDAKTSDYASRFKLVFSMNDVESNQVEANSFAYINNGEIVISNEGRATLQVIDVMGRIISSEEINGEARISTKGMTAGLYILNLNGNVQKIVVR